MSNSETTEKINAKKVSDSKTIMSELVMPNDTNPMHNLMGGNLLRWMDIAAGICAGKHCEAHVVTASVDHVHFEQPIRMGEVITIDACVSRAFNTSVEIFVEVFAANLKGLEPRKCTSAFYTFVALDDKKKKPIPVPGLIPLSQQEQNLYDGAQKRRELRLLLSGRIKADEATEIKSLFKL